MRSQTLKATITALGTGAQAPLLLARMELKLCPAVPELHLVTQRRTESGYLDGGAQQAQLQTMLPVLVPQID